MAAHPTARRVILVVVASLIAATVAPGVALGARGDGPYTPFPEGSDGGRSQGYVNRLNERNAGRGAGAITPEQLARGVVTPAGKRGGRGAGGGAGERGQAAQPSSVGSAASPVGSAASPFGRAGFSPASPPPNQSPIPFFALGGLLGLAAVGVGAYRVRRRWAA